MAVGRRFAVLGSPISHSKSPVIHEAAYRLLGLPWSYEAFEVAEAELEDFLSNALVENRSRAGVPWGGFSLTMPLKTRARELSSTLDGDATASGVVNTITFRDGLPVGANTDISGIVRSLADLHPQSLSLLGTGATARSAVLAASKLWPGIGIWGRSAEGVTELADFAAAHSLKAVALDSPEQALDAALLISTLPQTAVLEVIETNLGFRERLPRLREKQALFDVSYAPWPSLLAKHYLAAGGTVVSGLEMLIWQAIEQIQLFAMSAGEELVLTPEEEARLFEAMKSAAAA